MDENGLFLGSGFLQMFVCWLILTVLFGMLRYLFRNSIVIEGFSGHFFCYLVLIPANVFLASYLQYLDLPQMESMGNVFFGGCVLLLNVVLMLAFSTVLPALMADSLGLVVFFAGLFSMISVAVRFAFDLLVQAGSVD
jgi:hypothetical protein